MPSLKHRLSSLDAAFLYLESNSSPTHIGGMSVFEGEMSFERYYRFLEERIHLVPRYRQRLAEVPLNLAHATLEDDPDFKLENHVKRHRLKSGITEPEVIEQALRVFEPPLDRSRPLWENHLLEGLKDRTVVVQKIHHALVDGVSTVELAVLMSDFSPTPRKIERPSTPRHPPPMPGRRQRLVSAIRDLLMNQADAASRAAIELLREPATSAARLRNTMNAIRMMAESMARPIVETPWQAGVVGQRRSFAFCRQPFADYRAIRNAFGGTINDVVLAVLTEGAARYLKYHGWPAAGRQFRLGCPVSVRRPEERANLGNRVSMMFPMMPAESIDLVERLALIVEETTNIKKAGLPQAMDWLAQLADLAPAGFAALAGRIGTEALDFTSAIYALLGTTPRPPILSLPASGINFIATNVPGVQVPLYMDGHRLLYQTVFVGPGATIGFGVPITSYKQEMFFHLTADPRLMPDVDRMKQFVDDSFLELRARARRAGAAPARENGCRRTPSVPACHGGHQAPANPAGRSLLN
jgi:WS/DGAT/MGAT family acyltransferase